MLSEKLQPLLINKSMLFKFCPQQKQCDKLFFGLIVACTSLQLRHKNLIKHSDSLYGRQSWSSNLIKTCNIGRFVRRSQSKFLEYISISSKSNRPIIKAGTLSKKKKHKLTQRFNFLRYDDIIAKVPDEQLIIVFGKTIKQ